MKLPFKFFHSHPRMEQELKVDQEHVIVDRKDFEMVRHFLREKGVTIEDIEDAQPKPLQPLKIS